MPRRKQYGYPFPHAAEMGELVVDGEPPGRVLLGRLVDKTIDAKLSNLLWKGSGNPALAAPWGHGVLVVGPARCGKSKSLLIPAVRRWYGPVIATSIRNDIVAESWETRERGGWPVLFYNPMDIGGYNSDTWSPLTPVMGDNGWTSALRVAASLVEAAGAVDKEVFRKEPFWNDAAAAYLPPLLFAAAKDGPGMDRVMHWLNNLADAREEIPQKLEGFPDVLDRAESLWSADDKLRQSVIWTAKVALKAYDDPAALRTCLPSNAAGTTKITGEALFGSPGATLYIVSGDPTRRAYFAPLFAALIESLLEEAFRRAGGGVLDPPLLLALDEAANIAPIKELPRYSSQTAGAGVQLITILQDFGQAEDVWGKASARTLLTNHSGGRLIFAGTVDSETLKWASEMLGETYRPIKGRSRQGLLGKITRSTNPERQPVATPAELRTMPKGHAILISGNLPAAEVRLTEHYTV